MIPPPGIQAPGETPSRPLAPSYPEMAYAVGKKQEHVMGAPAGMGWGGGIAHGMATPAHGHSRLPGSGKAQDMGQGGGKINGQDIL